MRHKETQRRELKFVTRGVLLAMTDYHRGNFRKNKTIMHFLLKIVIERYDSFQ